MIYEIDKYTDYLIKLDINANQFYLCWLLYTKDYDNLKKYVDRFGNFNEGDIKDLIDKGLLLNTNPNANSFNTKSLYVALPFAEEIIVEPDDAWDELMEAYPREVIVNNTKYPSTGLKWEEEKELKQSYTKEINKNKFLHRSIIKLVKEWGERNGGYAQFKIDKFITSKYWRELKKQGENHAKPRLY